MASEMFYDRVIGSIRPFHEDQQNYIFRYFCGDDVMPVEQSLSKAQAQHVCDCGTLMFLEKDSRGPRLRFGETEQRRFASKPRR